MYHFTLYKMPKNKEIKKNARSIYDKHNAKV